MENEVFQEGDSIPVINEVIQGNREVDEVADLLVGNDQSPSIEGRKSRKKFKRRRGRKGSKVKSPVGLERPNKRAREGSDPFDIDRFIGILHNGPYATGPSNGAEPDPNVFCTPDLNKVGEQEDSQGFNNTSNLGDPLHNNSVNTNEDPGDQGGCSNWRCVTAWGECLM
ncbi:hypothetical protein Hanom_Chr17g01548341 [Helianthus anomalus]